MKTVCDNSGFLVFIIGPFGNVDERIRSFLQCYRSEIRHASITPKMHLMEDHVVQWIRQWQFGLGFHGEHGAESIHARMNSLLRTYCNVRKPLEKLKQTVIEHNRSVCPAVSHVRPQVKRRKKDESGLTD